MAYIPPATMKSMCPGCALELEALEGPTDPYGASSPACWAAYGIVMAREFSGEEHFASHRLSVDAYMSQHPSRVSRAAVQSVWLHLVGLCLVLERRATPDYVGRVLRQLSRPKRQFDWLDPPPLGGLTVSHVVQATSLEEYQRATRRWAGFVWDAWLPHHGAIRALADGASTQSAKTVDRAG
jgi:hypothetical protein